MTIQEAMDHPGPDRLLPRYTFIEDGDILVAMDAVVDRKWQRAAKTSMERIVAKVDKKCNYKN